MDTEMQDINKHALSVQNSAWIRLLPAKQRQQSANADIHNYDDA